MSSDVDVGVGVGVVRCREMKKALFELLCTRTKSKTQNFFHFTLMEPKKAELDSLVHFSLLVEVVPGRDANLLPF